MIAIVRCIMIEFGRKILRGLCGHNVKGFFEGKTFLAILNIKFLYPF
jgi:hypothetical protein